MLMKIFLQSTICACAFKNMVSTDVTVNGWDAGAQEWVGHSALYVANTLSSPFPETFLSLLLTWDLLLPPLVPLCLRGRSVHPCFWFLLLTTLFLLSVLPPVPLGFQVRKWLYLSLYAINTWAIKSSAVNSVTLLLGGSLNIQLALGLILSLLATLFDAGCQRVAFSPSAYFRAPSWGFSNSRWSTTVGSSVGIIWMWLWSLRQGDPNHGFGSIDSLVDFPAGSSVIWLIGFSEESHCWHSCSLEIFSSTCTAISPAEGWEPSPDPILRRWFEASRGANPRSSSAQVRSPLSEADSPSAFSYQQRGPEPGKEVVRRKTGKNQNTVG